MKRIENVILKVGALLLVVASALRHNNTISCFLALFGLAMLFAVTSLSFRRYIANGKSCGNVRIAAVIFYVVCILAIIFISILIVKNRF
ncbi:MAG TPA: hypothetical protein DEQ27_08190 [Prevotella sp.]|nr:hypothetical protein [Prevotella sp.]